jgi:hypothetical protein
MRYKHTHASCHKACAKAVSRFSRYPEPPENKDKIQHYKDRAANKSHSLDNTGKNKIRMPLGNIFELSQRPVRKVPFSGQLSRTYRGLGLVNVIVAALDIFAGIQKRVNTNLLVVIDQVKISKRKRSRRKQNRARNILPVYPANKENAYKDRDKHESRSHIRLLVYKEKRDSKIEQRFCYLLESLEAAVAIHRIGYDF